MLLAPRTRDASNLGYVETAAGILILVVTLVSVVVVGVLFVWAAQKDGGRIGQFASG